MTGMQPSAWALERFGHAAESLANAVPAAIRRAHDLAIDAHLASEVRTNDVYGSALWVNQHEQLVEQTSEISGVGARKPSGVYSRFSLVVVHDTNVVIYPWRYATDHKTSRRDARMRPPVSDLRQTLLTLTAPAYVDRGEQLSFDDLGVADDLAAAQRAEEDDVLKGLAEFGRVVTVGYASNPAGLIDLGWGDCELVDDRGHVTWPYWESLPFGGTADGYGGPRVPTTPVDGAPPLRFDAGAQADDDFGLTTRSPLDGPPISEPQRPRPQAGNEDEA